AMIYHGLRPEFNIGTPKCYVRLAKQCTNSDIKKRPTAVEIINKLENWKNIIVVNDSNVKSNMKKGSTTFGIFNKLKKWRKSIVINDSYAKLDKQ
ncbi:9558_t:CDS:1, partial [Cetraspora pellucida]